LIAADAGKAVLRTIAAESATFVLLNIFVSPGCASVVPVGQIKLMCVAKLLESRRVNPEKKRVNEVAAPASPVVRQAVSQLVR